MDPAEFACCREGLGLTRKWAADWLGVSERTLRAFEDGRDPIPGTLADALIDLDLLTDREATVSEPLVTFRTDADAREGGVPLAPRSVPGADVMRFPASWHRALTWRRWREYGGEVTYYVPQGERE